MSGWVLWLMQPKVIKWKEMHCGLQAGEIAMLKKILEDLQDPDGAYPINTSVTETEEYLYIGSLVTPVLGRLPKTKAGLR